MLSVCLAEKSSLFKLTGVGNIKNSTNFLTLKVSIIESLALIPINKTGQSKENTDTLLKLVLPYLLSHTCTFIFWDEEFHTACFMINRMLSHVISGNTPLIRLFAYDPDYSFLRVFGCTCWPNLRPYNSRKLAFRTKQCVFLGYSGSHKGYKCLDQSTGRVYISCGVVFDEQVFSLQKSSENVSLCSKSFTLHCPSSSSYLLTSSYRQRSNNIYSS